jgi:hypothetical protein
MSVQVQGAFHRPAVLSAFSMTTWMSIERAKTGPVGARAAAADSLAAVGAAAPGRGVAGR